MSAVQKVRSVALNWLSGSRAVRAREFMKLFPTFFTGCSCILLQSKTLQIKGITVVSERHPRPLSQRVGALAREDPVVQHRVIWQGEKQNS